MTGEQKEVKRVKINCREATKRAVFQGKITRTPCEVCGSSPAHAHHADYGDPLSVKWLCRKHHWEEHRRGMTGGLDMENPSCPELVAWLKEESFTKADLAKLIGVTHQAINRFLLGKAYLHPKNEMAIVAPTKGEVGYADLRPYLKGGKVGPNGLVKPLAVPRKEKKVDADGNG